MGRFALDQYGEFDGDYYHMGDSFAWVFDDGTAIPFEWNGSGMPKMGELTDAPEGLELYAPEATGPKSAPRELVLATSVLIAEYVAPYHRAQKERAERRKRDERHRKAFEKALKKAKARY